MKITKSKLQQIIKEEIEKRKKLDEISSGVQNAFEILKGQLGAETLVDDMLQVMNDAEAMEIFKSIAMKRNIDLSGAEQKSEMTNEVLQEEVLKELTKYFKK